MCAEPTHFTERNNSLKTCQSNLALRHPRRNRERDFCDGIRWKFGPFHGTNHCERKILYNQDFFLLQRRGVKNCQNLSCERRGGKPSSFHIYPYNIAPLILLSYYVKYQVRKYGPNQSSKKLKEVQRCLNPKLHLKTGYSLTQPGVSLSVLFRIMRYHL